MRYPTGAITNSISYKTNAYTYKDEHLTNVSSGVNGYDLAYDALGRCVKRVLNGVTKDLSSMMVNGPFLSSA